MATTQMHDGAPAEADGWLSLPDVTVVDVSGRDARDFLARQFTCDVRSLTPATPLFGAWLTPKGRAQTLVRLVDAGDGHVLLLLPTELADALLPRLRMFVLRDQVTLEPETGMVVAGLAGRAVAAAADAGAAYPSTILAKVCGRPALALMLGARPDIDAITASLSLPKLPPSTWRLLQVLGGIPQVSEATREAFIPQMLNLDRLDAVSFAKGCYPGQEIVARTQHLGRIKRRMFIARCVDGPGVNPGDPISVNGDLDAAGRVVLAGEDAHGQALLAVLPLDAVAAGAEFRLGGRDGPLLHVSAPPYPLDGDAP